MNPATPATPQPGPARDAFTEEQFASSYPDGIQRHYWQVARSRVIARRLRRYLPPNGGEVVLDVGCGRGIEVENLRRMGWNALGCDLGRPAPISAAVAPYLTAEADAFQLPDQLRHSVKCVLMLDLLEHLAAPGEFLALCRERFPACELVFITVPARMEVWSNYDKLYGHARRYSLATARALFPPAAFQVVDCGYFFHLLYGAALALACLRIQREVVVKPPARPALHACLGACFSFEERIVPACVPGSSLYLVARILRAGTV